MSELVWDKVLGYGFLEPDSEFSYDSDYIDNFTRMSDTDIGRKLNKRRLSFVESVLGSELMPGAEIVDVGIGSGAFVDLLLEQGYSALGFDVAPSAVEWLRKRGLFLDVPGMPVGSAPDIVTAWDSIEHMRYPSLFLRQVDRYCFVTIPLFESKEQALLSHHFKPNEHIHYWTENGFAVWMERYGWRLLEKNRMEEDCGRADVGSFAFARMS